MAEITAHMLVQNEDQFVWYAIQSVLPFVDRFLITDNGSTDQTISLIKSIDSPKIELTILYPTDRSGLVARRRAQIDSTSTEWILLVDGDEIWPNSNLKKLCNVMKESSKEVYGIVCRTRNSVGDIYNYQFEESGKYNLLGKTGHLTIRALRNHATLELAGTYPNEAYTINGLPIQNLESNLIFVDTWYLHTTHLKRSSNRQSEQNVIDRIKKYKLETGRQMPKTELPQVFSSTSIPVQVPRPQDYHLRGISLVIGNALSQLKSIKRKYENRHS